MYLTENRGGLGKNNYFHVLQKICKYYLDCHLDGWAVVVPRLVNERMR